MSYEWLNENSRKFLSGGYLSEGENAEERIRAICDTAENILQIEGFSDKLESYMQKGWISLSTPIWANFGKSRGLPISCFSSYIDDNVGSIMYAAGEVGIMSKVGGGTSGYFGNLRPRGSSVSDNGKTSGAVHFMELFQTVTDVVSQGGVRRGRFAPYLPIDHGDIDEFLDIGTEGHPIQTLTTAVCVPDWWVKEMKDGDKAKRKVWAKLLRRRSEVGYPYIFFTDNANSTKSNIYRDKDIKIHNSQLCIVGSDRVVSDRGYLTAKELYEQGGKLTLFDGTRAVESSEMKLREKDVPVYRITLSNGLEHTVTDYHKIVVIDERSNEIQVQAKDLCVGDKVSIQTNKGLFGQKHMPEEAFLLGLYQSDGTQNKEQRMIDIWENDFDILEEVQEKFNNIHYRYGCDSYEITNQHGNTFSRGREPATFHDCNTGTSDVKKKRLSSRTLYKSLNFEKGYVPSWIWESDEKTQWEYVRGLLIADGTARVGKSSGNPLQIAYADINKGFLKELQLLFNNLGLISSIRMLRKGGETLMPNGKGGHKMYQTKDCWRLIISNKKSALEVERNTGFLTRKNVAVEDREYLDNTKKCSKIVKIEYYGKEDVYCPTVDTDEHVFVSQGIRTVNCSEILLPTNSDESFVCDLASVNVKHFDDYKDTDVVETVVFLLDAVMTEFIEKIEQYRDNGTEEGRLMWEYLKRAHKFSKNHRALGLGVLGLHSYYQSHNIPFVSAEAERKCKEIFSHLQSRSYKASEDLAQMYGECEMTKGYGRRNTTLNAVAPTTSSAFILGQVSQSIEPLMSNYYIKDLAKLKFEVKNKYLEKLLEEKGHNTEEVWTSISKNDGSVQHLTDILTEHEREVFLTFSEMDQKGLIKQASIRQKYLDQTQSMNLMIPTTMTPKEVNEITLYAHESGLPTLYYQHSTNAAQQFIRGTTCEACEL